MRMLTMMMMMMMMMTMMMMMVIVHWFRRFQLSWFYEMKRQGIMFVLLKEKVS